MRGFLVLLVCLTLCCFGSLAEASSIGNWVVTIEKDPFSPKKKTIAVLPDTTMRDAALAIRCFPEGGLSVVVMLVNRKHYDSGTKVPFKYRADEGDINEDEGSAFGSGLVEMPNARQILTDAIKAKKMYVRITDPENATFDITFAPRLAAKALTQVNADCADAAEDKSDANKKSK